MEWEELAAMIDREAADIYYHAGFTYEDARKAVERAVRYYVDRGECLEDAWELARQMVATAIYAAREKDFSLAGMIDHMILSVFHRVQSGCLW